MAPTRYFDKKGIGEEKHALKEALEVGESSAKAAVRGLGTGRRPQTTLFVSSLPFNATSTDLTTLFSDVGPLRRAFVVTDKDTGKSKGVGYVTFAVSEDAEQALAKLQGHSLDGKRKMRLEWSTGKDGIVLPDGKGNEGNTNEGSKASGHTEKGKGNSFGERDPNAVRTIIITGLKQCTPATDSKTLYKRARKIGDVENVVFPAPSSLLSKETSDDVAHVVFRTPNHAMTAVTKLHAHTFKGAQISVVLKKRADGAARLDGHMRSETKEKRLALQKKLDEHDQRAASMKKTNVNQGSRLIIRNLPFDVTEKDLRAVFLPFGPIYSIDVPQKDGKEEKVGEADATEIDSVDVASHSAKTSKSRGRGFAFVWMVSRNDAVKAMAGVNGTLVGRGAAEKATLKAAKGKAGRDKAKEAQEEVLKSAQPAREVAVDWALSKSDWENRKEETDGEESGAESTTKRGERREDDEFGSDFDPMDVDGSLEDGDNSKPALPKPEDGTTLFVRNLPYQATEEELRDLFRSFGPMRYAKLTLDKQTKRPKGTAFICFWQKESAENALEQAHRVAQDSGSAIFGVTRHQNPFSAPSILTADPSSTSTAPLTLHGRVLSITSALERSQADSIADAAQSAREKKDKRNTYLMREGVPMPGSNFATRLSEAEIDRRLQSFQVRKSQMAKNPSLYVSKTRLSVRQLPLFVTENILKRMAEHAVKEFDRAVADGEQQGLSNAELAESQKVAADFATSKTRTGKHQDNLSKKQELKAKREEALLRRQQTNKGGFIVQQTKVIRAKDRLDPTTGKGRSQGYGFVEMTTFADALKVVRFINGNASMRKLMLSWYAEELGSMAKKMEKSLADAKDAEGKARLKRITSKKEQLDAGQVDPDEEGTRGGMLIVEFSIENVVTVKRRSERIEKSTRKDDKDGVARSNNVRGARSDAIGSDTLGKRKGRYDEEHSFEREKKKVRRPATWNQKTKRGVSGPGTGANTIAQGPSAQTAPASTPKAGTSIGSMIGRKRKQRHLKQG